ncbi:MAG: putative esterase, partial [uncultured Blastococcus sp.]
TFQNGAYYWSAGSGAHAVSGPVAQRWAKQGWELGRLGYPTTDTVCGLPGGGCSQEFQGGSILSSTAGGTRAVWGAIRARYVAVGGSAGALGYPTSEELCGFRDGGCFQRFQHATIYWSPASGARVVANGAVATRWGAQGWELGRLGYPTTDTVCGLPGGGCSQEFQGGSILSSTAGGTRAVWGAIRARYVAVGGSAGALGYPTSEELCGFRDGGCFQRFQHATIYWSPGSKAWPVAAPVLAAWGTGGWENGRLGYPVGAATCTVEGACTQRFQGGTASWTSTTAVRIVY